MAEAGYFGPDLFEFLDDLRANNERAWFQAHRSRYERYVREPLLRLIRDFGPPLRAISPHFEADPRPLGGSMFRIHRDTRFSHDKSPYKTHAAAHFRHAAGKDVHAPGFYLHLAPEECFAGVGIWHPDAETLEQIRRAIVERPAGWGAVRARVGSLEGESLKRPPRGYDPDHPYVEDLKRRDFIASAEFDQAQVCGPDFLDTYAAACRSMSPLAEFLTKALGLAW
jgi:uncharacterized protein (TIGR02453 family)